MTLIEASYRLTTPLFCGGVTSDRAELRLPSFKGVLRFWWRALAWSRCSGELAVIQDQEDQVFGSASTGQARISMRLKPHLPLATLNKDSLLTVARGKTQPVGMGARYLGYGLMAAFASKKTNTQACQLSRAALQAPLDFVVQIRTMGLNDDMQASLLQALITLGTLGGMGSRSRRGYGSLTLQSLTCDDQPAWAPPRSAEALAEALQSLLAQVNQEGLPEYTALSREARFVLLSAEEADEPLCLLDLVGREMVRFRSWGKGGKILTELDSEKNFEADHDLMNLPVDARSSHPERIAFGLPHNYGKGPKNEVSTDRQLDRRASPLLIHIHQCGSQPVAVLSFLPARFLPTTGPDQGSAQISVGGKKVAQKPEQELYQPIHTFLNRLLDEIPPPKNRKEPFTTALKVPR
jgi:CRISPR-associated protein Cmr1